MGTGGRLRGQAERHRQVATRHRSTARRFVSIVPIANDPSTEAGPRHAGPAPGADHDRDVERIAEVTDLGHSGSSGAAPATSPPDPPPRPPDARSWLTQL
jgi:hypothetical protein